MPKKIIQDIIVNKRKAEKSIKKELKKKPSKKEGTKVMFGAKKSKAKVIFIILLVVLFSVLGVKIVSTFSKIVIKIKPHQETILINALVSGIPLKIMEIEVEKEKTITATGSEEVEKKASGQIIIYNAFSSRSQTLVKNTRFETPDGKIYRIRLSTVVPGTKILNGEIVSGSVEMTVYADKAGEEYNIEHTDFTIPGFKGGARYEKFFARSKTPMTGGLKGTIPIIPGEDFEKTTKEIENILTNELTSRAELKKPNEYLLYEEGIKIEFGETPKNIGIDKDSEKATIRKTAKLTAFLVPKKELSNFLVKKYLTEDLLNKVRVSNIEDLNFELVSKDFDTQIMTFKIRGNARFVWEIHEDQLKEALIASPKNIENAFILFPEVEEALVVFKPSWWQFFPDKTSKISIEKVLTP